MVQGTPAVCEIDNCGVLAVGRCATCGRAFCSTHQARTFFLPDSAWTTYVDMCAPCLEVKNAEQAKRNAEAAAPYGYFNSGAARADLLSTGVPPVNLYQIGRVWKNGFFGLGDRYVDVPTLFGRGWILDEFKWKYYHSLGETMPACYGNSMITQSLRNERVPAAQSPT